MVTEEQRRLVHLPCKVGDTVYVIEDLSCISLGKTILKDKVTGCYMSIDSKWHYSTNFHNPFTANAVGETVFLTREEAEAALKGGGT